MQLQELVPGADASLRPRIKAMGLQNVFDRVARDRHDPKLLELPEDPGVAPTRFPGQLENQLANLFRGPFATPRRGHRLATLAFLPNPAPHRVGMHDRDQVVERPTKLGREARQSPPLLRRELDPRRQLLPHCLALNHEKAVMPNQLFLGRASDQHQERAIDVPHGGQTPQVVVRWAGGAVLHTAARADRPRKRLSLYITVCSVTLNSGRHQPAVNSRATIS